MVPEVPGAALLVGLLTALRQELEQYGEMLARLEQQQEYVIVRAAEDVLRSAGSIQEQMDTIQAARQEREKRQADVASFLRLEGDPAFARLLPVLPAPYRVAIASLVREINDLLARVQHRARQNHLLLGRSLEMMQQFLSVLLPVAHPKTYNGGGQLQPLDQPVQVLYQAVG